MEQNKIPTTEDILRSILGCFEFELSEFKEHFPEGVEEAIKIIKEQNKLHVKASLEAAYEKAQVVLVENCDDHTPYWGPCVTCGRYDNPMIPSNEVDKKSILNAYPENLIQ